MASVNGSGTGSMGSMGSSSTVGSGSCDGICIAPEVGVIALSSQSQDSELNVVALQRPRRLFHVSGPTIPADVK